MTPIEIRRLEAAASQLEKQASEIRKAAAAFRARRRAATPSPRRVRGDPLKSAPGRLGLYTRHVLVVLRALGRSARAGELVAALAKRGVRIGGANPAKTLANTLGKSRRIERPTRGWFAAARLL